MTVGPSDYDGQPVDVDRLVDEILADACASARAQEKAKSPKATVRLLPGEVQVVGLKY